MHTRKQLISLLAALLLTSCATLGMFSGAQYEFEQGMAFFNRGSYEEAIARFQKATEHDPNFAQAYLYLGRSYVNLKRWRQAVPPLRTAYRLAPDQIRNEAFSILIDALFGVAADDFRVGDFKSSVTHLRELLDLQPTSSRAREDIVRALIAVGGDSLARGDISQALVSYSEAIRLSPHNFDAALGLAKAAFRNGEFQKSFQALQNALKLQPGSREAQSLFNELQSR